MLWDLVRDFFVQHIFGGNDSSEQFYNCFIGYTKIGDLIGTNTYYVNVGGYEELGGTSPVYITFGDYLSTIATIVTMVIIVVLCCLFIKKIVSLVGGLIRQ